MNRFFRFVWRVFGPIFRFFQPVSVEGLENLPPHGALLCPNHSSNWDPVLLVVSLPIDYRLHIMAKDSLFRIPVLSWVVTKLGAFPVARGNSDLNAVKTAIQSIKCGDNLLIFPEGTRVEREGDVPAKGGVAMIGIRTGAVLVPVFVDGKKRIFRRSRIIIGQPYQPSYTGRHGTAEEVQAIADEVLRRSYALGKSE
ncbi:1-acyl-sn-glycerol-3-phosphate acyltransferase [Oscillibacter hominis]|uniref:1-acyl-sn-glycerol-3-phosphate acyltransferase n=1 Tax=Oscillibacter hominis TaxID=2763056 RepID=A0A7G9B7T5_9FIRM|nr:lysophospholipid acyltransferase family protein [Oscillibacter hominis]QNL45616.1 1-acyl-sn-glycerol-3-phosphate acyltransferase [Oscillibacter hominis]